MTFAGWIATLAGWYVTEIGRQPWLVYGVLATHEAASEVPAAMIATTFLGYMTVYAFLLAAYVGTLFYLAGKGRRADVTAEGPGAVPEAGEVAAEAALGRGAPARA
jgi:cytochrome d ubiquinol oxidase subunit I